MYMLGGTELSTENRGNFFPSHLCGKSPWCFTDGHRKDARLGTEH